MCTLLLLDRKNKFWYSRHTRSIYLTIMQCIPQHRREELECIHLKNIMKFYGDGYSNYPDLITT
jgi:hypothetical protein